MNVIAKIAKTTGCRLSAARPRSATRFGLEQLEDRLTPAIGVPDVGNTLANALTIVPDDQDAVTLTSCIETAEDVDVFTFVAQSTGRMTALQRASLGSGLNSSLRVLDQNGAQVAVGFLDFDSLVQWDAVAGERYFLEAAADQEVPAESQTGDYDLLLRRDDFAGDLDVNQATEILFNGFAKQTGNIEAQGDTDVFRFVASETGLITVLQKTNGSAIDSILTAYNATGTLINSDDDSLGNGNAIFSFFVVQGATYFLEASAFEDAIGEYELELQMNRFGEDDFGDDFATAAPLALTHAGFANRGGVIESQEDTDFFRITMPLTGRLTIAVNRTPGSTLITSVLLFDGNQNFVAFDSESGAVGSLLGHDVSAGEEYFIAVSSGNQSLGTYELLIATLVPPIDDAGNSREDARFLQADVAAGGTFRGTIGQTGDVDFFSFVAPSNTNLAIEMGAFLGSNLNGFLRVFDANGNLLTEDDDSGRNANPLTRFFTIAGETYFIEARAANNGVGEYILSFREFTGEDFGNSDADAYLLELYHGGISTGTGVIEEPSDIDVFTFFETATGQRSLFVRNVDEGGSTLRVRATIRDDQGNVLDTADTLGPGGTLTFFAVAGEQYFIEISALDDTLGNYAFYLFVNQAEFDDSTPNFTGLLPGVDGVFRAHGVVGDTGFFPDRDLFTVGLAAGQNLQVDIDADLFGSTLNSQVFLVDSQGNILAANDNSGNSTDSFLTFSAPLTNFYTVVVTGHFGYYTVSIATGVAPLPAPLTDEVGDSLEQSTVLPVSDTGAALRGGVVESASDVDVYSFTATVNGVATVLAANGIGAKINPKLSVFNSLGLPIASNNNFGTNGSSLVQLAVRAGETYFIQVESEDLSIGGYLVYVRTTPLPADDFGDTPLHAELDPNAQLVFDDQFTAQKGGFIEALGDLDVFKFVAPISGTAFVTQTNAAGTEALNNFLQIFDVQGNLVGERANAFLSQDVLARFNVSTGETYYIFSSGDGLGGYDLNLSFEAFKEDATNLASLNLGTLDNQNHEVTVERLVANILGVEDEFLTNGAINTEVNGQQTLVLRGNGIDVLADTIHYQGVNLAAGLFTGGANTLDPFENPNDPSFRAFQSGVVLGSGNIADLAGKNYHVDVTNNFLMPGLELLNAQVAGNTTQDAAAISFDFIPTVNAVRLRFVFTSEEYLDQINTGFNDVFGFFVNGVNYARVPGTGTFAAGTGELIAVDSINNISNSSLFINNSYFGDAPFGPLSIESDGQTVVLTMQAPVVAGAINTLTLAIADTNDGTFDSLVFVQEGSFTTFVEEVNPNVGNQQLNRFTNVIDNVVAQNPTLTEEQIHQLIHKALLNGVLKEVDLVGGFLVVPVDPVDFTLTAPGGAQISGKAGQVSSQVNNAFFVSDGPNQVVIVPNAKPGDYKVELAGVGAGDFRWGASYVEASGKVTSVLLQGNLQNANVATVLDFANLDGRTQFMNVQKSSASGNSTAATATSSSGLSGLGLAATLALTSVSNTNVFNGSGEGDGAGINALAVSNTLTTDNNSSSDRASEGGGQGAFDLPPPVAELLSQTIAVVLGQVQEALTYLFTGENSDAPGPDWENWQNRLEQVWQTLWQGLPAQPAPEPATNSTPIAAPPTSTSLSPERVDLVFGTDNLGPRSEPDLSEYLGVAALATYAATRTARRRSRKQPKASTAR